MEQLKFLEKEPAPKVFRIAYDLIGTKETIGKANNPVIMTWAKETGLMKTYNADSIPWCGLFVAYCVLLLNVWIRSGWHFFKVALALLVSFIPLGTFWFERKYLNENQ